jgi:hypothetical protein
MSPQQARSTATRHVSRRLLLFACCLVGLSFMAQLPVCLASAAELPDHFCVRHNSSGSPTGERLSLGVASVGSRAAR